MPPNTQLSSNVTVSQYREMVEDENKDEIASFLQERFTERYITPFQDKKTRHGFSMMAISCLMIEALESFLQGKTDTNGKSKKMFKVFFKRSSYLNCFSSIHEDFYKNVRCGLLHQAETTNGWKIRRLGKLLNKDTKEINATWFMKGLEQELNAYCEKLKKSDWDSEIWNNLRNKMDYICKQCAT